MDQALSIISAYSEEGIELRRRFFADNAENIRQAAFQTAICFARGGKLLLCGNGGSAADAQHVAGEFVNKFLLERPALPAISLPADSSIVTAIGNDGDFAEIFSRQVEAFGKPGDALLAISTSGESQNVLNAMREAKKKDILVIGLTGRDGGRMNGLCDILIVARDLRTPLIQEMHIAAEHLFCQLCDYYLFENPAEIAPYLQEG